MRQLRKSYVFASVKLRKFAPVVTVTTSRFVRSHLLQWIFKHHRHTWKGEADIGREPEVAAEGS